jgi:hypothetical protein
VTAYDPLLLNRTTTLLRASQGVDPSGWGNASNEIHLDRDGGIAFDLLGAGYFMVQRPDGAELRERPGALPRLTLVESARRASTPTEALATVMGGQFDPLREIVVENVPGTLQGIQPSAGKQRVVVVAEQPGLLEVEVEAPRGGYLVFSESYYPGWHAEEAGQAVPMVPADYALMGVGLSPGHHRLVLRFTIPWLGASLVLSGFGIGGLAGLVLISRGHTIRARG